MLQTYGDGSINGLDAYLDLPVLPAGNYLLAIGAFPLSVPEVLAGVSGQTLYPATSDGLGDFVESDHGDYQIIFSGDLAITRIPPGGRIVPEPASWLLLLFGIAQNRGRRRRLSGTP